MKYCQLVFLILLYISKGAYAQGVNISADTAQVIKLNKEGFKMRLKAPEQTVAIAYKALTLAEKINYIKGIGESYRIMGIANSYLAQPLKAISNYLYALKYFEQINDLKNEGKVYNNIGNLYRDNDYDQALLYFNKALKIATKLCDKQSMANLYLNIGAVYFGKNSFNQSLYYTNKSNDLFVELKDSVNLVQSMQNKGVTYYNLHQFDKAEKLLLEANNEAKILDLNENVARIDITLADIYIAESKFSEAETIITEGITFSRLVKSEKTEFDFKYSGYLLELKKKDYKSALNYLTDIYQKVNEDAKKNASTQIDVIQNQFKEQDRITQNKLLLKDQEYDRVRFWAILVVVGLLLISVGLLVSNVRRKAKTNTQLKSLNAEVSRQKDNLDRINHHLEEIIDERTKDLQVKNKKLSEYSSYLSHQIRGPIATLKGLMNLEKEGLVDQPECIKMMNKCVSEIDDKIIEMSDMLHDPARAGF